MITSWVTCLSPAVYIDRTLPGALSHIIEKTRVSTPVPPKMGRATRPIGPRNQNGKKYCAAAERDPLIINFEDLK